MEPRRTPILAIRKRDGIWKIMLLVWVGGRQFPYAVGVADSWAEVPRVAEIAWDMRPGR